MIRLCFALFLIFTQTTPIQPELILGKWTLEGKKPGTVLFEEGGKLTLETKDSSATYTKHFRYRIDGRTLHLTTEDNEKQDIQIIFLSEERLVLKAEKERFSFKRDK